MIHPQQVYEERIVQVQEDRYCWVHEEFADGISPVSSVVHDVRGRVVGALPAHGPTYRLPAPGDGTWVAELIRGQPPSRSSPRGPDDPTATWWAPGG